MKSFFKPLTVILFSASTVFILSFIRSKNKPAKPAVTVITSPKIQAAILLDVSGSMEGLIEQAKAQLWNMVNVMGKARCDDRAPQIEIALYEYGRSTNNKADGYVKKINGFISDLDSLSQNLFSLKTNGGDEYCGQVIFNSLQELQWDVSPQNYKVIFIAGNEDFLQGNLHYSKACNEAKNKGVIVNTIYCGDRMQGIKEHWNLAGECGNGNFTTINHNAKDEDIPTPYDSLIYTLNDKLNGTYITYTFDGFGKKAKQVQMDEANASMSKSAGLKRIKSKSNSKLYNNAGWDLVDAVKKDGYGALEKIEKKDLPDSLRSLSTAELKNVIAKKSAERSNIQKEITLLNVQRDTYIAAENVKNAANNNTATLETEVERIIKEQALRFNMKIE